ncbi:cytochrome P450 [Rhypophila decipiens]|uniref:Benzoate 4-monooxygenase bphA n=1 Tax=Rhypophila decipiens TaxID=261697 RepID=A0AAN6Y4K5_9PEZI|nr:cytochrome P450 [Rhypophila decipiens]
MTLVNYLITPWAPLVLVAGFLFSYLFPYFVTYRHLRKIPSPFPAQFSDLWLLSVVRRGNRYQRVDELHKKLGPVVRIQPNHVSINDDNAIQIIYGHGNGFLKSDFYDAFVSIRRGLFNTRNRAEHTRKRKIVSHTFSVKSVAQFEPYIHSNLELFVKQWDNLAATAKETKSRFAQIDCLNWFNYLAFDVIGDLAFGSPFGMLSSGADMAEVRASPDSPPIYASAIEILNRRGEVSATIGIHPAIKPFAKYLPDPFFSQGLQAVESLAGIAIACVKSRLENPPPENRKDLLQRLMEGRDEKGERLGREELTAEALTQLIAGSDTTSNSSCALLYHVMRTPGVLQKLRAELDAHIGQHIDVPTFEMVRDLPYLSAVVNETLRHHSTSGIGLPREIPPGSPGIHINGYYFPPGTVLSVPTYSVHHSKEIWGPDADEFNPDRWLKEGGLTQRQKNAFIPFSYGPRACVGRNVAEMEMKLIVATWARRYDVELRQEVMETREGFLRKPLGLEVGIKRREVVV